MSTKKYVPFSRPELITVRAYRKAQLSAQRDWLGWPGWVTGWPGPGEPLPAKHPLVRPRAPTSASGDRVTGLTVQSNGNYGF